MKTQGLNLSLTSEFKHFSRIGATGFNNYNAQSTDAHQNYVTLSTNTVLPQFLNYNAGKKLSFGSEGARERAESVLKEAEEGAYFNKLDAIPEKAMFKYMLALNLYKKIGLEDEDIEKFSDIAERYLDKGILQHGKVQLSGYDHELASYAKRNIGFAKNIYAALANDEACSEEQKQTLDERLRTSKSLWDEVKRYPNIIPPAKAEQEVYSVDEDFRVRPKSAV